jgi:hypothetical protein
MKYDTNNYDIQYHDTPESIKTNGQSGGSSAESVMMLDESGNKTYMDWKDVSNGTTYYTPGSYIYGPSTFVPNYEESVYLSKKTYKPPTPKTVDTGVFGGALDDYSFCSREANKKGSIESACSALSADKCGKSECCVLLGGTKCVGGDETGPYLKSNYSDIFVKNRDFYYYTNKCYGNCGYGDFPNEL